MISSETDRLASGRFLALRPAFFLMGLVATSVQVLLLRRLMGVLYGNEMVVGGVLAVWMVGTGVGSAIVPPWASERKSRAHLAALSLSAIVVLFLTLAGTYSIRAILSAAPGQVLPPGRSFLTCVVLLLPLTAILGAMFVFFSVSGPARGGERIGFVYLFEALGAGAGGVASGLAASWGVPPFAWGFAAALGLLALLWITAPPGPVWRAAGCVAVLAAAALIWGPGRPLATWADKLAWPGRRLVATVESRYAGLAVTESEGQRTLFVDALPVVTFPDPRRAEQTVHTALLQHPHPRRVLIIGGGLSQAAAEVFKHDVGRLDYVQMDPAMTRMERDLLPEGEGGPADSTPKSFFDDPRVSVHNVDGRLFVNESKGPVYDVIIVDAPNPATVLINRLYTAEFFARVKRLLTPGGVLAFTCGEVENYVGRSLGRLAACESATLATAFKYQKILPLGALHFVASDSLRWLAADGEELARRLEKRSVSTSFMRDYYLSYDLSPQRVSLFSAQVARAMTDERPRINRDRYPVAYFYYLTHWYRLLGSGLASAMELPWGRFGPFSVPLAAVTAFLACAVPGLRRRREAAGAAAVTAMGFASMTSQVVILIALQTFRGYLFHSVGLVVAAFMVGISLGALWARRRVGSVAFPLAAMAWYNVALAAAVFLPLDRIPGGAVTALASALSLAGGLAGGAVFQRAAAAATAPGCGRSGRAGSGAAGGGERRWSRSDEPRRTAAAAGLLNACDHIGAAVGALVAATMVLPALGLPGAAALAAAAAGGAAAGLALSGQ